MLKFRVDIDKITPRHGVKRGEPNISTDYRKVSDNSKIAFAKVADCLDFVEIGPKSVTNSQTKYSYNTSKILLYLDDEQRNEFLENLPIIIGILKSQIKAHFSKISNLFDEYLHQAELCTIGSRVLSDECLRKLKSGKVADVIAEHNEAFSKCYPKSSEIVAEQERMYNEKYSASLENIKENIYAEKLAIKAKVAKIEKLKRIAHTLLSDDLRKKELEKMVSDIASAYEINGINEVTQVAYTELIPSAMRKGKGKFTSDGVRFKLYLSTIGKEPKEQVDFNLTPIYLSMMNGSGEASYKLVSKK